MRGREKSAVAVKTRFIGLVLSVKNALILELTIYISH